MEINFPLSPMQLYLQSYLPSYNLLIIDKTYWFWKTAFNMQYQLGPLFIVAHTTLATIKLWNKELNYFVQNTSSQMEQLQIFMEASEHNLMFCGL